MDFTKKSLAAKVLINWYLVVIYVPTCPPPVIDIKCMAARILIVIDLKIKIKTKYIHIVTTLSRKKYLIMDSEISWKPKLLRH